MDSVPKFPRLAGSVSLLGALLLVVASSQASAQCVTGSSVTQWRCSEQTITSNIDLYNAGAGNPYRDLVLRVTFTWLGVMSFTQDAFWAGDPANSTTWKNFKVRVALPGPATWTWQVAGCTGTTNGKNCATDVTWTQSTTSITVTSSTSGPQLFARGFPTQFCFWQKTNPPVLISCPPITYSDASAFFWLGDTAWSAPAVEIDAQLHGGSQYWSQYLATRTPDGTGGYHFTAILVAPADYYNKLNDPDVFSAQPGCTVPLAQQGSFPNDCSIPKPTYWSAFDNLVSQANSQDLFIVLAGLLHPFDTHPYSLYPSLNSVTHFSRYMAARMAGFAAMFSPGFDLPLTGMAVDGSSLRQVMDAAGFAVQAASPRALITNHLNGQATCTDYELFGTESPGPAPWMTSYLFQSGHAINQNGVMFTSCPGYLSSETSVVAAMRRAITMPTTLAGSSPSLPTVNGEGPYDDPTHDSPPDYTQVNMQYRTRQAANLTCLSDAQGFTYGVPQLGVWNNPSSYWGLASASSDMKSLRDRFIANPGLPTHTEWIVNNPAPYDQEMTLASNGSNTAIAYLPAVPLHPAPASITLSTSGLPQFGCPASGHPWTFTWENPSTNKPQSATLCDPSVAGQVKLQSPGCTGPPFATPECDWVLLMTKTGAPIVATPQSSSALAPTPGNMAAWRDLSAGDGTSAIEAYISGAKGGIAVEVSPSGMAFQDGVRVASVPNGYVVVWHADELDGSLFGVFGQRVDSRGRLLGPMFRVNSTTAYDQRDPAIAADPAGNTIVVWSSFGQDGDLGGIYGQLYDPNGRPMGGEFQVNSVTAGHQVRPQVTYLVGGGFAVGWTTEALGSELGALSVRVFDRNDLPLTAEIRSPGNTSLHPELVDLEPDPSGGFGLQWQLRDNTRKTIMSYLQHLTAQGAAAGAPGVLP
jgi:hypothetical protein